MELSPVPLFSCALTISPMSPTLGWAVWVRAGGMNRKERKRNESVDVDIVMSKLKFVALVVTVEKEDAFRGIGRTS